MNREILILAKNHYFSDAAIEKEMQWLNDLLAILETPSIFCTAHELVNRNRITNNPKKIITAIRQVELKAFRFLIGKN